MPKFHSLSETEMELMNVIWKKNRPFRSNELLDTFSEKEWKGQTISTFLTRLVYKGLLSVKKEGRANIYTPCLTLQEYQQKQAQSLLDAMYQGSVNNFLAALYEDKVTPDELDELQRWFSDK